MTKIGRNDPCPCGSGKKYKHCCAGQAPAAASADSQPAALPSLDAEVDKVRQRAVDRQASLHTLGVFIFFTTTEGDGWLLEMTDMDALQIVAGGKVLAVEISATEQAIEIHYSHRFAIRDKRFIATAYADRRETVHENYPASRIETLISKARRQLSPEMVDSVHISNE